MKILELIDGIRMHFGIDAEVTPELGEEIASFVRGQAEPHACFYYVRNVLNGTVTGDRTASFPVSEDGYATTMLALRAATEWAVSCGALTYEFSPWSEAKVPTSGHSTQPAFACDAHGCGRSVSEENAHYIEAGGGKLRLCRFHAEVHDPMPETCAELDCGALLAGGVTGKPELIDDLWYCQYHAERHDPDCVDEPLPTVCEWSHCEEESITYSRRHALYLCERHATEEGPRKVDAAGAVYLDRSSSLWRVITCMRDAILQLSDNDYIYADDKEHTNISHEEVSVIINHLTHGNEWSAIQYSDSFDEVTCTKCHQPTEGLGRSSAKGMLCHACWVGDSPDKEKK